jgi:molybdopterin synthase catalytic subunit
MRVRVRCFASVRELLGAGLLELEIDDGTTVAGLKAKLAERAPRLLQLPLAHAVNRDYAPADRVLEDGDEVAFIPPISGGSDRGGAEVPRCRFELVDGPLDARPLEAACRSDRDGALVTFAGVTRDHNQGQQVRGLRYEAYAEMAVPVMERILAEVAAAHEVGRIRVAHRLGEVPIGEASVVVVVAAPHRGPAFDACRAVMDRLKAEVPIFKQEVLDGPDGGARWVGELPRF